MPDQDSIEDAQYLSAISDPTPKQLKPWKFPSQEELDTYIKSSSTIRSLESICQGSLGFYIFTSYLKQNGGHTFSNFLADVARFRNSISRSNSLQEALSIVSTYLVPISRRGVTFSYLSPNLPQHIDQPLPPTKFSKRPPSLSRRVRDTSFESKWLIYIHMPESKNRLKVSGDPLAKVINDSRLSYIPSSHGSSNRVEPSSSSHHSSSHTIPEIESTFFDEIDQIVFYYCKQTFLDLFLASPQWQMYSEYMCMIERPPSIEDFSLGRVLGRGGFGTVYFCQHSYTGKPFAMKMIKKSRLQLKKSQIFCLNERKILSHIDSHYIVSLKYALSTEDSVILVMNLLTGGDLGFHLKKMKRYPLKLARYFAARTVLGIAALHSLGIVHRDIKPRNILMSDDGRTQLTDFGFSCRVGKKGLVGTLGTRGYWAPEMLRKDPFGRPEKYSLSVDWFSFGCMVYEFLYGFTPFRTKKARNWGDFPKKDKLDRQKAIDLATLQMEPEFDQPIDETTRDFLSRLLLKDGHRRLGSGEDGSRQVMMHEWFADIDWPQLQSMDPPFVPDRHSVNTSTQEEIRKHQEAAEKQFKHRRLPPMSGSITGEGSPRRAAFTSNLESDENGFELKGLPKDNKSTTIKPTTDENDPINDDEDNEPGNDQDEEEAEAITPTPPTMLHHQITQTELPTDLQSDQERGPFPQPRPDSQPQGLIRSSSPGGPFPAHRLCTPADSAPDLRSSLRNGTPGTPLDSNPIDLDEDVFAKWNFTSIRCYQDEITELLRSTEPEVN